MRRRIGRLERALVRAVAAASLPLVLAGPLAAQSPTPTAGAVAPPAALTITTTYPSIEADPGGEATFPISVTGPRTERIDLAVTVPDGFEATLLGDGSIVGSVTTGGDLPPALELKVDVPDGAAPGSYLVVLTGRSATESAELPVDVIVTDLSAGSVSMTTDFPALRGDSEARFQFNLRLTNDTSQEVTFGLSGLGPQGWEVEVRPTGQDQAATAVVGAGKSQNVRVTVTPARFADAGQYPVRAVADGGEGRVATTDLLVELTGSYSATLTSVDGRVNTTASAGNTTTFGVAVTNTGTAALTSVKLTGTVPSGWKVKFEPETIESIPVGETATSNATITPSGNAVAGDYMITMRASNDQVEQSMQVRTTVETSPIGLIVGAILIAAVLLGLFLVFRRYGRR